MPRRAQEVLSYFLRHPQAADSLEGVARWRLAAEAVHRNVDEINEALGWLVQEGFLLKEAAASSDPIFCLNPAKEADARRLVMPVPKRP